MRVKRERHGNILRPRPPKALPDTQPTAGSLVSRSLLDDLAALVRDQPFAGLADRAPSSKRPSAISHRLRYDRDLSENALRFLEPHVADVFRRMICV